MAIAILWTTIWIRFSGDLFTQDAVNLEIPRLFPHAWVLISGYTAFSWLLIGLAALDAEHYWLPDWLTLPGIGLGLLFTLAETWSHWFFDNPTSIRQAVQRRIIAILAAAAIILIIRLAYWLIRRREGMGLGDAKLMAMLGAWLGFFIAVETFAIAVFAAATAALIWLAVLAARKSSKEWANMPLPLGTFLCLAALPEIFYPNWLWNWYAHAFLP